MDGQSYLPCSLPSHRPIESEKMMKEAQREAGISLQKSGWRCPGCGGLILFKEPLCVKCKLKRPT